MRTRTTQQVGGRNKTLLLTLGLPASGARPPAATARSPSRSVRKHAWRGRSRQKQHPRHGTLGRQQIRPRTLLPGNRQPAAAGSARARPVPAELRAHTCRPLPSARWRRGTRCVDTRPCSRLTPVQSRSKHCGHLRPSRATQPTARATPGRVASLTGPGPRGGVGAASCTVLSGRRPGGQPGRPVPPGPRRWGSAGAGRGRGTSASRGVSRRLAQSRESRDGAPRSAPCAPSESPALPDARAGSGRHALPSTSAPTAQAVSPSHVAVVDALNSLTLADRHR